MAVPANITALNLNGKFQMNKSLSDSPDDMLSAQGVGWIKRKAMGAATITVTLTHSKDASGMENLSLVQVVSGGDPAEPEEKVFDWVERKKEIKLFGPCVTKSKRVSLDEVQEPFLKEGWSADTLEHGCILVHLANEGKNGWKTEQTWGIGEVNGERRHVRRICLTGSKGEKLHNRIVYDYLGEK
ncbi:hypothetical protein DFJ43DRAFT_886560 [Lentinula guzmanii]|uniref:LCCL domain-containing protein n=1 Tax=Lentinula guzmanii TaxID=2804957 RepID=A0AA38J9R6_9AGAR|nr:hypothetical protein DFJ43DRAFT_886560 [Lentinula guzmanii]KAJ3801157.1 hypothetical protein GGU11DRAFT_277734 [Lentinula aff. detonsa]